MPARTLTLVKDLIASIENEELRAKFEAAWATHSGSLDTAKGELKAARAKATTAEKRATELQTQLDAAGGDKDEALKALTAERDQWKTAAEEAKGGLSKYKLTQAVRNRFLAEGVPAKAAEEGLANPLDEAMGGFQLPEGAHLDDSGTLVGADEAITGHIKARPWLVTPVAPGTGGPGNHQRPPKKNPAPGSEAERAQIDDIKARKRKRWGLKAVGA